MSEKAFFVLSNRLLAPTLIKVLREKKDGVFPHYAIVDRHHLTDILTRITFQQGEAEFVGLNGISVEDLIFICKHYLECDRYSNGDPGDYLSRAIIALNQVLSALQAHHEMKHSS